MRSRRPLRVLVPVLAVALWLGGSPTTAIADGSETPTEARRLTDESMQAMKRGDMLQEGWAAEYERGIELANRAIAADPKLADAYYALFVNEGRRADRSGVTSQAFAVSHLRTLLEKTIELDPAHADAWEARGEMLLRLPRLLGGSTTEGERSMKRAAELAPRWAKPRLRLAELEWSRGHAEQARTEAEAAHTLALAAGDRGQAADAEALLKEIAAKGS